MPIYYPFQSRAGATESFNFLGTDRYMADIGEPLGFWSPTLCRVPEGPRWIHQDAFKGPYYEVSPADAAAYFQRHPRYFHLPPGGPADTWKLLAGMPEQLALDLRNTQPTGQPEAPPRPPKEEPLTITTDAAGSRPEVPVIDHDDVINNNNVIDYDDMIERLAKASKPTQAALVRYMRDKDAAAVNEIAHHVHGDDDTSERAMSANARRTSESLVGIGWPLSFRVAGGMLHKEISPE